MMNNSIYILRKKSINYIENKLLEQFNLKLCYRNDKESIFKNNDLVITCKEKYVLVLIYDYTNEYELRNIKKLFS